MKTHVPKMMRMLGNGLLIVAATCTVVADAKEAHIDIIVSRHVISCAAIADSSGDYILTGTMGEPVIGLRSFVVSPAWSSNDLSLFQDNFSTDGTLTGTVRIDMARDIRPHGEPDIQPGDSLVVNVAADNGILQGFWPRFQAPPQPGGLGIDPSYGKAAVYVHVRSTGGQTGDPVTGDPSRWPVVDTYGDWTKILMDTVYTDSMHTHSTPGEYCLDLNDHLFEPPDQIEFYFSAVDANENTRYWSQRAGVVEDEVEAMSEPMEMQCLPTGNSDILYVNHFGEEGLKYFEPSFEQLNITPDRYDVRGASSTAGNSLASRATIDQVIGAYRTIIWHSGDLSSGTVGDGTGNPCKEDDFWLLHTFLDWHSSQYPGIYFTGDDMAEEWIQLAGASAVDFINTWIPHALVTGNHTGDHGTSPLAVGEYGGIFDHGPSDVDSIVTYGAGPPACDFDQIAPTRGTTLEMTYSGTGNPSDGAVVAHDTLNSNGNPVAVVLSGFSFHSIRDDRPEGIPDRVDHLMDILQFLGHVIEDPVGIEEPPRFVNALHQNYPNPFNPITTVVFSLKEKAHVSLKIYNVAGQLVRILVNEERGPGEYDVIWKGRNDKGEPVASGVYFYRMVTKNFTDTKKMVIIK